MRKIPTILERDEKTRRVTPEFVAECEGYFYPGLDSWGNLRVVEKIDGTNIRVTVSEGHVVRIEKRRNPNKMQKAVGIVTPWYVDADWVPGKISDFDPADGHMIAGVLYQRDFDRMPTGEWSAEAIGPKIQGNPYALDQHTCVIFSDSATRSRLELSGFPHAGGNVADLEAMKGWMLAQRSRLNPEVGIEGVVFWWEDPEGIPHPVGKLKLKDFA